MNAPVKDETGTVIGAVVNTTLFSDGTLRATMRINDTEVEAIIGRNTSNTMGIHN